MIGTVRDLDAVPLSLLDSFKHQIRVEVSLYILFVPAGYQTFQAPDEGQRLAILKSLLQESSIGLDVSLENIATQTAALVARDLADVVALAHSAASERILDLA